MRFSFDALPPVLRAGLAGGATVVTPNKRLARHLTRLHDDAQRVAAAAWSAAVVMPWDTWLGTLWEEASLETDLPFEHLLSAAAAAHLWEGIVEGDPRPLLDRSGAAALAADAWALVHAWGRGGESWRGWRDDAVGEDPTAFAQWAERYRAELLRRDAVDRALLPDALAASAARVTSCQGRAVVLAGFLEHTPQQDRLLAALAAAGMRIEEAPAAGAPSQRVARVEAPTARDEIAAALRWAIEKAQADPAARIGIVVDKLTTRREEVLALAFDVLAPAAMLPGAAVATLPFDLSLGEPLAQIPIVACALALAALPIAALPMGAAAALSRSVYLPAGAEGIEQARARRAALERSWLLRGDRHVAWNEMIGALLACDRDLAQRWIEARRDTAFPASATPREWCDLWRTWLQRCGWPGMETLDSAEWQAKKALDELFAAFATLSAVARRLSGEAALRALRRMAEETVFQPEQAGAPIEILGVLEAAGQHFDGLWVAGLTAERWPAAPTPNALLPVAWQRDRGVPRSSPARELAYAQALTALLAAAADEVVFSSAVREGDAPLLPSALLLSYPRREMPEAALGATRMAPACLERLGDDFAPALAAGTLAGGGAGVVARFADCPFQALASRRLRAEPWPAPLEGLSPAERGTLLHAALAQFWRDTRDQAELLRLNAHELQARIAHAAEQARAALVEARWARLAPIVAAGETRRLAATLSAWLEQERVRPAFAVRDIESEIPLELGGIRLKLRLDRVDMLAGGGLAILDYKSGLVPRPAQWLDRDRPVAPQLGLYALAMARAIEEELRAVAYIQLRPDEVRALGLAADASAWPHLTAVNALQDPSAPRDWRGLQAWWEEHLGAVIARYAQGEATVDPRDRDTCTYCGRQALCRIGATPLADAGDHDA